MGGIPAKLGSDMGLVAEPAMVADEIGSEPSRFGVLGNETGASWGFGKVALMGYRGRTVLASAFPDTELSSS